MANPPTCRVCGTPHWSGQPHRFKGDARSPSDEGFKEAFKTEIRNKIAVMAKALPQEPQSELAAYLAAERARKAAYMRQYRAKKN